MAEAKNGLVPRSDPGAATAESGIVLLDGPDGVAVSMTAEAARLTADSLKQAAAEAERQGESTTPGSKPPKETPRS